MAERNNWALFLGPLEELLGRWETKVGSMDTRRNTAPLT